MAAPLLPQQPAPTEPTETAPTDLEGLPPLPPPPEEVVVNPDDEAKTENDRRRKLARKLRETRGSKDKFFDQVKKHFGMGKDLESD